MPAAPMMNVIASAPRVNGGTRPAQPRLQQQQQHGYFLRTEKAGGVVTPSEQYNATAKPETFERRSAAAGKSGSTTVVPAFRVGRAPSKPAARRPRTPSRTTTTTATQLNAGAAAGNGWLHKATAAAAAATRVRGSSAGASARAARPAQGQWVSRRQSRVTLVLDLDETLVHSSFDPVPADLHLPVALDGEVYTAYVKKRPHVDEFLARCTELFDVVVWTASLAVYADPLVDELCRSARCGNVKRMFRESCTQMAGGGYAKDLSKCGRSLDDVCILDNSPSVAQLQPRNLIPIVSWYDDPRDTCLRDLLPHLERLAMCGTVHDVIPSLPGAELA